MRLSELVKFLIRALQIRVGDVTRHRHFSCDLPGLRILSYQSSESGKVQPDAHQIKFGQKNEKEVAREEELRDI